MEDKINFLKNWLGTGSINVFGLPMSGKDTVGLKLAEVLGAKFLSSGDIIRKYEAETKIETGEKTGVLIPSALFSEIVLPALSTPDLAGSPLVLSSVGRWSGEETEIMSALAEAGHETKAVVYLDISENQVLERRRAVLAEDDRGGRVDDVDTGAFLTRISEFREKTLPVITKYRSLGLLVPVKADMSREEVLSSTINKLYDFAISLGK
jgi:adenylate kinase family enzyme